MLKETKEIQKLKLLEENGKVMNYPPHHEVLQKIDEIIEQVNLLNKNVKRKPQTK